jgi:hypothetical protein
VLEYDKTAATTIDIDWNEADVYLAGRLSSILPAYFLSRITGIWYKKEKMLQQPRSCKI